MDLHTKIPGSEGSERVEPVHDLKDSVQHNSQQQYTTSGKAHIDEDDTSTVYTGLISRFYQPFSGGANNLPTSA